MKKLTVLVIVIIALLVFYLCRSTDDTSEISEVLNQMVEAGEKGMQGDLMDHVSIEYRDDYGASYLVVKNVVDNFFQKFSNFDTKFNNLAVSLDTSESGDKTAVANLDIHIIGYRSGAPVDILGTEDSYQNVTLELKKTKLLGWKITKAEGFENIIEEGI